MKGKQAGMGSEKIRVLKTKPCWGCTLHHSATSYGSAQEGARSPEAGSLRNRVLEGKQLCGMYPDAPETMIESRSKRDDGKGTEGNTATKEIESKELQRQ